MSPVSELLFFHENPLTIAVWNKIMLFGPGSRCGEKSSHRLSFLSIFSHKVELFVFGFFFSSEQLPMQMLYK